MVMNHRGLFFVCDMSILHASQHVCFTKFLYDFGMWLIMICLKCNCLRGVLLRLVVCKSITSTFTIVLPKQEIFFKFEELGLFSQMYVRLFPRFICV